MQIDTIQIKGRDYGIHFNGDYFLDDYNNVFLMRQRSTRNWFVMVRPGYIDQHEVDLANVRLEAISFTTDYRFRAALVEYRTLLETIYRRF